MCGHLWGLHITATTAIYKRKVNIKLLWKNWQKIPERDCISEKGSGMEWERHTGFKGIGNAVFLKLSSGYKGDLFSMLFENNIDLSKMHICIVYTSLY